MWLEGVCLGHRFTQVQGSFSLSAAKFDIDANDVVRGSVFLEVYADLASYLDVNVHVSSSTL